MSENMPYFKELKKLIYTYKLYNLCVRFLYNFLYLSQHMHIVLPNISLSLENLSATLSYWTYNEIINQLY